ncbi:uncharacterized protein [Aquarana catesbeiana]|uniref:uncharacterized protein n=1 Tax=Aquarana catesbeiana TaxID=8400 RepID=UPI003CCA6CE5
MKNVVKGLKKRFTKKSKNKHVSPTEKVHLLPGTDKQEQKNTKRVKNEAIDNPRLKDVAEKVTSVLQTLYKLKRKGDIISDTEPEQWKDTDKTFSGLLGNFQYYKACVLISKLEDEERIDVTEFYYAISQKMWEAVDNVLTGDQSQSARLQTIPQCIKWAKETQSKKDADWGPQGWIKELEDLFEKDIKETIPKFAHGSLEDHLKELKHKISKITSKVQIFPKELASTYLKCLHVCLLNDLTCMAERKLGYNEQVLLYKWTTEEHGKLCKHLQGSADFDHMLFEKWFFDNGKKIEFTGQEVIQKELKEILQNERMWNSYPSVDVQCYFNNIQKVMASICEAVKDLSATLVSRLNSIFWEEFLKFLTRYEDFLKNKVDKAEGMTAGNGVEMGIRILKNCYILRDTLLGLGNMQQESEIMKLLDKCENKGTEIVLRILNPRIKSAFKNYFKKNKLDYENVLKEFRNALGKQGMENNKEFNTVVQHRIKVLYIQSFFKNKSKNKVETFVQGSKKLKEFFTELVSDEDQLGNDPLEYMGQMLTANDFESLQTTTIYFLNEHQDLRKEHLVTILKIKGGIKHEEKAKLLYYIENRKILFGENRLKFFEDVNTGFHLKNLLCFQCCCA